MIERSTNTVFDALASIGGFSGLVSSVFATLVLYLSTSSVQSDLRQSLFGPTENEKDSTQSLCERVKALFLGILAEKCHCCSRKWREAKATKEKEEDHLNAEINLLSIVRKVRYIDSAVKMLIHPATRKELQEQS